MQEIFSITAPIYLALIIGFVCTRAGLFTKPDLRALGKFVVNVALPAMIGNAIASRPLREIFNPSYLLAYGGASLAVMGLGLWWFRRRAVPAGANRAIYAMGMCCSNSGYVGYPILLLALPAVAGVALALSMVVENVVMIPLLLTMAEREAGTLGSGKRVPLQVLRRLLSNPLILGLLGGLLVSLSGWVLPAALARTVTLFSVASGGLSLFVIGGALVGLPMAGLARQVLPIAGGKLLLHPLAVLLTTGLLQTLGLAPLEPSLRLAAVLLAAMPMMGVYPLLAQKYGQEALASAALLLTTVCSFATLNVLLWGVAQQRL